MKRLIVHDCPLCEKVIWRAVIKTTEDGRKYQAIEMTEEGTHFWIKSNYGSIMKIAICKDCLKTLDIPKVAGIIDNIVYTWFLELIENKDMSEDKKRYEFNKARFYVAVDFADTEEKLLNAQDNKAQ